MKKLVLVTAVAGALSLPLAGHAAEAPAHTFTGNVGIFSNYIFRGVTQTSEELALQGGFDYAHASGFYAGTWGSNVSWLADQPGTYGMTGSSLELDVYGGFKGAFGKSDFGYDVGAIYYYYPGEQAAGKNSPDTAEVYGALSWKWLSAKLSWAATDYFALNDSKNSYYVDLSANYPIGNSGVTLIAHYGLLKLEGNDTTLGVSNDDAWAYSDWKVGASYALPQNFVVGAVYTDTDAEHVNYTINGKEWSDGQFAIYLQKTF